MKIDNELKSIILGQYIRDHRSLTPSMDLSKAVMHQLDSLHISYEKPPYYSGGIATLTTVNGEIDIISFVNNLFLYIEQPSIGMKKVLNAIDEAMATPQKQVRYLYRLLGEIVVDPSWAANLRAPSAFYTHIAPKLGNYIYRKVKGMI